jgi:hypothetical protein
VEMTLVKGADRLFARPSPVPGDDAQHPSNSVLPFSSKYSRNRFPG